MSRRVAPPRKQRHVEWKVVSICEKDHAEQALKIQTILQALSDEQYNVTNMMQRGDALIITASRLVEPPRIPELDTPPGDKAN